MFTSLFPPTVSRQSSSCSLCSVRLRLNDTLAMRVTLVLIAGPFNTSSACAGGWKKTHWNVSNTTNSTMFLYSFVVRSQPVKSYLADCFYICEQQWSTKRYVREKFLIPVLWSRNMAHCLRTQKMSFNIEKKNIMRNVWSDMW